MLRRLMILAGLGAVIAPLTLAQPPRSASTQPPGYMVIRVNLTNITGTEQAQAGGEAGGDEENRGGGQPAAPGPGGRGGLPGVGGFPGAGGFPGMMGGQGQGSNSLSINDLKKSVVAIVPYKRIELDKPIYRKIPLSQQNPPMPILYSDYGTAALFADNKLITLTPLPLPRTLATELKLQHDRWSSNRTPQGGLDLVGEALAYGLIREAYQYAEDTAKSAAVRKDVPPTAGNFVKAFNVIKTTINSPVPDNPDAAKWQTLFGGAVSLNSSAHYHLLHWGDQATSTDLVKKKLDALENNMRAFYLWNAVGGAALKMPEKKMLVILAEKSTEMAKLRIALDGLMVVSDASYSDAFYVPSQNMMVLSPERIDDIGRTFNQYVIQQYRLGWNRDDLLKGIAPNMQAGESVLDVARVMMLALVDKVVDEETLLSMLTREGCQQLYAAAGVLNPYVVMPEWVQNGSANLLHKPKGPYYSFTDDNRPQMTLGIKSGYGAPNYVLVRQFTEMLTKGELNPNSVELLTNTLLDRYFDAVRTEVDPDPPPVRKDGISLDNPAGGPGTGLQPGFPSGSGPPGFPGRGGPPGIAGGGAGLPNSGSTGSADGGEGEAGRGNMFPGGSGVTQIDPAEIKRRLKTKLERKSQATAWALVHFLAKRKMPALLQFYAELNRMPRDMHLDKTLIMDIFCRTFNLMETNDPTRIDQVAFKRFANDWIDSMKALANAGVTIPVAQTNNQNSQPGFGSGGFPGISGDGP